MGQLEQDVKTQIRKSKINSALFAAAAVAGGLPIALLAPNILGAISKNKYYRQHKYQLKSSLSRLIAAGYLVIVEESGKKRVCLTPKGERYAALLGEGKLAPKVPKKWDKKWRILIFDIPEKRKKLRHHIRATLINLGFVRLQKSVWVCPYDCEDIITIFKADLKVGKDLLYIIADKIEFDKPLRAKFELV